MFAHINEIGFCKQIDCPGLRTYYKPYTSIINITNPSAVKIIILSYTIYFDHMSLLSPNRNREKNGKNILCVY